MRPTIVITAGDPSGIGPEVILKMLTGNSLHRTARLVIIGDLPVFQQAARCLHRRLPLWEYRRAAGGVVAVTAPLTFLDCGSRAAVTLGRSSAQAGRASLRYLQQAIKLWNTGQLQGLVTAPVTKWAIQRTHPSFTGHTEWLARATNTRNVVMMFASDHLRVVVLTRHIPLKRVPVSLTSALFTTTLRITAAALRRQFGIRRPRLALCGMNPHAGEGHPGTEEHTLMVPAMRRLRRQGIICEGPFAADGFFAKPVTQDTVICAYHDQGLIPFKMAARDCGCQVTLGLPFVRTSPDHGSALDIAGKGLADPGSMRYALRLAIRLASRQMR